MPYHAAQSVMPHLIIAFVVDMLLCHHHNKKIAQDFSRKNFKPWACNECVTEKKPIGGPLSMIWAMHVSQWSLLNARHFVEWINAFFFDAWKYFFASLGWFNKNLFQENPITACLIQTLAFQYKNNNQTVSQKHDTKSLPFHVLIILLFRHALIVFYLFTF